MKNLDCFLDKNYWWLPVGKITVFDKDDTVLIATVINKDKNVEGFLKSPTDFIEPQWNLNFLAKLAKQKDVGKSFSASIKVDLINKENYDKIGVGYINIPLYSIVPQDSIGIIEGEFQISYSYQVVKF